ncbi:hypothetical protein RB195_011549 [Necator americanus]|uniref:RBR-type E3 ubiquitin transferase n=1 Tax=Necator americanus TaxID=51031 RepID=A0ABR1D2Z7_NECAM
MSLCDLEDYFLDDFKVVRKGHHGYNGSRRCSNKFMAKRTCNQATITKTLYDPQNTLSKRKTKRLLTDCSDGFYTDVPYSLNKQERWKYVNPDSLLRNYPANTSEVCIVSREVTPLSYEDYLRGDTVTDMHVFNEDVVTKLSSAGRKKAIRYYINQLNEKRHVDKDEVEPARILLNIVRSPPVTHLNENTFRIAKRRRHAALRKTETDKFEELTNDCCQIDDNESTPESSDFCETAHTLTLADFITSGKPLVSARKSENLSSSIRLDSFEIVERKPAEMVNISEITNAPHIFEIFDISIRRLDSFDLKEEITLLAPGYCTVHWFGSERVSLASKRQVQPMFVLFFEIDRKSGNIRIRININASFSSGIERNTLEKLLETRKNFPSLFESLIEFIFKLELLSSENKQTRYHSCKDNFMASVNSERMAAEATPCGHHEQLEFVRPLYIYDGTDFVPKSVGNCTLCCRCSSPYKPDLFTSTNGMMCRECVASFMIRQLRLNHSPVEIPLITSSESSPVDLLYAILPLPLMTLIVKISYLYHSSLLNQEPHLLQCPKCSNSLAVTEESEYNSCICSVCGCCWCYLCGWEPHWPLNCEEFKEWSKKWDIQYLFDKFNLREGERLLRIKCICENIFYAPEDSAHGTLCGGPRYRWKCWLQYDKEGLLRDSRSLFWPYTPRFRKKYHHPGSEDFKYGARVQPEYLKVKKIIKKVYADRCGEVRRLRFNQQQRITFEENVEKIFDEEAKQHEVTDIRKTALILIENCTAWLYLHRSQNNHHLKEAVSRLFNQYIVFQEGILNQRFDNNLHFVRLDQNVSTVIDLFRQHLELLQSRV